VARHAKPEDIVQPGTSSPYGAPRAACSIRAGHTEAGCDLAQLAGFEPAAVICEILNEDGSMARLPDLIEFAKKHGLKIGAIRDLIQYRLRTETLVRKAAERTVSTAYGDFTLYAFEDETTGEVHFAAAHGAIEPAHETWCGCTSPSRCSTSSPPKPLAIRYRCPRRCAASRRAPPESW